jgi:hypothetical protein
MLKWLKEKATKAAANQCKINIRINTKTLVTVANRADDHLVNSGGSTNERDIRKVANAQKSLLTDIMYGVSNGLSLDEIKIDVIDSELKKVKVSDGAQLAIEHVIKTAANTLGVAFPIDSSDPIRERITTFFKGNVKIESFDIETTKFRVVENNAVVSVDNATHLRLIENHSKIAAMPHFEIIAPLTAVEVIEGEIPKNYLHEFQLDYYLTLRKYYSGE